jgi:hypothetical protein
MECFPTLNRRLNRMHTESVVTAPDAKAVEAAVAPDDGLPTSDWLSAEADGADFNFRRSQITNAKYAVICRYAKAYLDAQKAERASPAPQAGVPREPTEAMVQAAYDISNEGRYFIDRLPRYWRAMYDAAPSADAGGREAYARGLQDAWKELRRVAQFQAAEYIAALYDAALFRRAGGKFYLKD